MSGERKPPPTPRPIRDERSRYEPAEAEVAFTAIEYRVENDVTQYRHVIYTIWKELPSGEA